MIIFRKTPILPNKWLIILILKPIILNSYLLILNFFVPLQQKHRIACVMIYLNQFHREATERKLKKIAESQKSPMNSVDAANYMKRNFEMAKAM